MQQGTKVAIELLAKGMTIPEVAGVLEVTDSAISQVATTYADNINSLKTDKTLVNASNSARMDNLESLLLDKLERAIPLETDINKLVGTFKALNGAHRRDLGEKPGAAKGQTAALNLSPTFVQQNISFTTNTNNEVVEVAGRNLATAHIDHVENLAKLEGGIKDMTTYKTIEQVAEGVDADDFG